MNIAIYRSQLVLVITQLIFSFLVFVKVRFIDKRKDCFFMMVPLLMTLSSILYLPSVVYENVTGEEKYHLFRFGGTVAQFLATFVFALQYLKTGFIFPRLFTMAKIEHLQRESETDALLGV